VTLLIISPDYASHLLPLATLGTAWRGAGERVVVATGPATADIVRSFGFERVGLQLGPGSNPGVIRADQQPPGEDDALRGFFAATRRGMLETLLFQARARGNDLLWNPVVIADRVQQIVGRLRPDDVMVDHLAFSARLGLISGGIRHAGPRDVTEYDDVVGVEVVGARRDLCRSVSRDVEARLHECRLEIMRACRSALDIQRARSGRHEHLAS